MDVIQRRWEADTAHIEPEDIDALLAEVARLRAALAETEANRVRLRVALKDEIADLRAALAAKDDMAHERLQEMKRLTADLARQAARIVALAAERDRYKAALEAIVEYDVRAVKRAKYIAGEDWPDFADEVQLIAEYALAATEPAGAERVEEEKPDFRDISGVTGRYG